MYRQMKTISRVMLTLLIATLALGASAQKFGHINFGELYTIMPGQDSVKIKYDAYKNTLQRDRKSVV